MLVNESGWYRFCKKKRYYNCKEMYRYLFSSVFSFLEECCHFHNFIDDIIFSSLK